MPDPAVGFDSSLRRLFIEGAPAGCTLTVEWDTAELAGGVLITVKEEEMGDVDGRCVVLDRDQLRELCGHLQACLGAGDGRAATERTGTE